MTSPPRLRSNSAAATASSTTARSTRSSTNHSTATSSRTSSAAVSRSASVRTSPSTTTTSSVVAFGGRSFASSTNPNNSPAAVRGTPGRKRLQNFLKGSSDSEDGNDSDVENHGGPRQQRPRRRRSTATTLFTTPTKKMPSQQPPSSNVSSSKQRTPLRAALSTSKQEKISAGTATHSSSDGDDETPSDHDNARDGMAAITASTFRRERPSYQAVRRHLSTYQLTQVFRMHGHRDAKSADMKCPDVWACRFAPRTPDEIRRQVPVHLVATCGVNAVCFTDCDQNKVLMKYPHYVDPSEQFLCMDWTVVPVRRAGDGDGDCNDDDDAVHTRLLAVAGKGRTVFLINADQHICYRQLRGHTKDIVDLKFLQRMPYWLLSASEDCSVRLWDIGSVNSDGDGQCLAVFKQSFPLLKIALSPNEDHFLVSNDDCQIVQFDLMNVEEKIRDGEWSKKNALTEEPLDEYDGDGWHTSPVDFLEFINEDFVVSKGCKDELLVWKQSESTSQQPHVYHSFAWPRADLSFVSGAVATDCERALALVGSESGDLLAYDIDTSFKRRQNTGKHLPQPTSCLSHPKCTVPVRQVDISHDGLYVVAVNQEDAVWIWKANEDALYDDVWSA